MKTYLELEGKLGQKRQLQSDQSGPAQPITNCHMKKDMKTTEKRKKLVPIKKYKVKVMENLNPTTQTCNHLQHLPKPQPTWKIKHLHEKVLQRTTPHLYKTFQFMLAPHGLKQEKCQGTFLN